MNLANLLSQKRTEILRRWFDILLETYPPETSTFLRKQKDRFTNPVGATIFEGLSGLFDELLKEGKPEKLSPFLDNIIRIRAIQDFSPSDAVSFILPLKGVIREELGNEIFRNGDIAQEFVALESRIDALVLLSFDIFVKCREKLSELKADEVKRRTFRLLQRANLLVEVQEDEKDLRGSNNSNAT